MREHIERLCERGVAYPDLFEDIEAFRELVGGSTCAVSFQLPYPLDLAFSDYTGRGNRSDIEVNLRFIPAVTVVDERMRRTIHRVGLEIDPDKSKKVIECTQCIALMPLWGPRLQYYQKYCDLSERGRDSDVVIPREEKPRTYSLSGAITVKMYELELSKKAISETASAVRRFLRDYMALSLHEVEIPELLYSPLASPRADRYFPLGDSPDLLFGMFSRPRNRALRRVSLENLERAAKWPSRSFSPFESQILALKRLSDRGEPELALVGLMALVEWLLKESLPDSRVGNKNKKPNLVDLIQFAQGIVNLPEPIWTTLQASRRVRNTHTHEKPTSKLQSYDPASVRYGDPESAKLFDETAFAAFELFRAVNMARSMKASSGAT